jgi:hypothetical protein
MSEKKRNDIVEALMAYQPTIDVNTLADTSQQYKGGLAIPLAGGTLGLESSYNRPISGMSPSEWGAFLNYKRKF